MNRNNGYPRPRPNRRFIALRLLFPTIAVLPTGTAWAAAAVGGRSGLESILAYLLAVPVLCAFGLGLGSFAFLVNRLFRNRIETTHRILRARPGISLLSGVAVTAVVMGLMMILAPLPALQGLVFLAFLAAFVLLAAGAVIRFTAHLMEGDTSAEELPGAGAQIKAGLVLLLANLLPFLGTALVAALALAAAGAVLLGYFASAGRAAASLTREAPGPSGKETPPSG